MRVLSLSASHVKKGNTGQLIGYLNEQIEQAAIENLKMKSVTLTGAKIGPCRGCRKCMETGYCVVKDDFNSIAKKMLKSDLIIIGSPVYFHDVSGLVKNFIDRTYSLWHDRQLTDFEPQNAKTRDTPLLSQGRFPPHPPRNGLYASMPRTFDHTIKELIDISINFA